MEDDNLFISIRDSLPPIIARDHVERLLGGVISSKYLANLQSQNMSPPYYKVGRKVVYKTDELLKWLSERTA